MGPGTRFEPVLEGEHNTSQAKNLVLCSGKHYYTLLEALTAAGKTDQTSLVRVEELSPFPREKLQEVMGRYTAVEQVVWAQEEPANQGAWTYVRPRIEGVIRSLGLNLPLGYAGRKEGATTATAVGSWHKREVEELVKAVVDL
jgi:probable 2-oxoglutarate dehydrogenase E1 component DHKTD1